MGFLDEAKREKKEEIRQRKAMRAARKRIYSQHNGMVRKLLGQLGEETWGARLLGKHHVGKVELGKEFELEAGPWGWYVGKGRKGKSSVPYGLGTSALGEAEVYGVLVSFHSGDLSRACFAVIYGELGEIGTLFTPDLSQEMLQKALTEAFRSGPLDLGIHDEGVNVRLYDTLVSCKLTILTEEIKEIHKVLERTMEEAISKSPTEEVTVATCPACGSEIRDGVSFCPSCGVPLERGEPVPTSISQSPSQSSTQPIPQRTSLAARAKTDSNRLILVAAVAILVILTICCVCPFTFAVADSVLRGAGILPTHTPTATGTPTLTPTITYTPKLTDTPKPTDTPIPTATLTPIPQPIGVATVKGDAVNVRAGPGTNYAVVTKASKGDKFSVYARNDDGGWLQVSLDARQWVAAYLVELDVNIEQVPVAGNIPPTPTVAPNRTATAEALRKIPPPGKFAGSKNGVEVLVYDFEYRYALNSRKMLFGVRVDNESSSEIHVNPFYCTIITLSGATLNFSDATFSVFSNPFEATNVQPGAYVFGGLVFDIPLETGPKEFVYSDGTRTIIIDLWKPLPGSITPTPTPVPTPTFIPVSQEVEAALKDLINRNNSVQIEAFRTNNPELLSSVLIGKELYSAKGAIVSNKSLGYYKVSTLERIEFISFVLVNPTYAQVRTIETWSGERYSSSDNTRIECRPSSDLSQTYHIKAVGGQWLIEEVIFETVAPKWGPCP